MESAWPTDLPTPRPPPRSLPKRVWMRTAVTEFVHGGFGLEAGVTLLAHLSGPGLNGRHSHIWKRTLPRERPFLHMDRGLPGRRRLMYRFWRLPVPGEWGNSQRPFCTCGKSCCNCHSPLPWQPPRRGLPELLTQSSASPLFRQKELGGLLSALARTLSAEDSGRYAPLNESLFVQLLYCCAQPTRTPMSSKSV